MNDKMANPCNRDSQGRSGQSLAIRWFQVAFVCLTVVICSGSAFALVSQGGDAAWFGYFGQTGSEQLENINHDWCYFIFEPHNENWTYTITVRDLSGKLLFSEPGQGTTPLYIVPSDIRVSWGWSDSYGWPTGSGTWHIGAADYIDASQSGLRYNLPWGQSGEHVFVVKFNSATKLRTRIKVSSTGWEWGTLQKRRLTNQGHLAYYTTSDIKRYEFSIPGGTDPQVAYRDDSDNAQGTLVAFVLSRGQAPVAGLLNYMVETFGIQPPTGVNATDGAYDKVLVTWNSVSGATGYEVWRNTTNNPLSATKIGSTYTAKSYNDTATTPMRRYYYWVKTNTPDGTSGFSSSDEGYRKLAAPTGVEASDGTYTNKVLVTWNGVSEATGYEIWRNTSSDSDSATKIGSTTGRNYEDTAVTPERRYRYWVKAKNSYGTSSFSLFYDIGDRKLAVPTGVNASDGEYTDKVRITWNLVPEATGYEVWYHTANDSRTATRIADGIFDTVYDDAFATPGTTRYYWVKAENVYGTSDFSSPDTGYRRQPPPPEISVIPASRDFGSVPVGSYANDYFTVLNNGGGTLTGNARVPSPFHIISGGSYSLTAGQTQRVDVQFSPTSAGAFNEVVTFTGGGEATRPVTGTGILQTYTITASAGPNGLIVPSGDIVKNAGDDQQFTASSNSGYTVDQWYLDGSPVQSGGNTYKLNNIQSGHSVYVTFKPIQYTITASAGPNGSINPTSGTYEAGTVVLLTASPDTGYRVKAWSGTDNDPSVGSNTNTVTMDSNKTVSVEFEQMPPYYAIWPMFHHDLHLTGRSQYLGAQTNELKWTFTASGAIYSSPAIGADGTIYFGSEDGNLYAIEPDGSPKWTYPTGGMIRSSPAIGSDVTIYVGSCDNKVHAINPDGTPKLGWPFTTGGDVDSSPSIGHDGTIYVGSDDRKLYAINPDGTPKAGAWPFSLADIGDYHCPSIADDGTVYFACSRHLYAINPDGTEKWDSPLGSYHYFSSAAIADDGAVYIGTRVTNKLHAINPENGDKNWSYSTGGWADLSPSIGIDGTIYIGSEDDKLYAINPDGTPKPGWPFTTGRDINSSAAIGADGLIYIGSDDDKFYCINSDGSLKWSYTTGGMVRSSPAIGSDGTIYVGSYDGKLYAFGSIICDFCGANFGPPDGYVDVWDLMQFADHWHTSPGDNWDSMFDLAGPNFGPPDGYIDVWDLMVFADHWHEGVNP